MAGRTRPTLDHETPPPRPEGHWVVRDTPDARALDLARDLGPCTMRCVFCPTSLRTERLVRPLDQALIRDILDNFEGHVATASQKLICLESDDVLDTPFFEQLLDITERHQRDTQVLTPGLRLADLGFARRLVGRQVRFSLTFLSADEATYAAMTGRDDAFLQVTTAISNLLRLGLPFELSTVLTSHNVAQLPDIVAYLITQARLERLVLRVFFPDMQGAPAHYYEQHPSYPAVRDALRALAEAELEGMPLLQLGNLPLCQMDPELLSWFPDLQIVASPNAHRQHRLPACASCSARSCCDGVHESYLAQHAPPSVDPDALAAVLAHLDGIGGARPVPEGSSEATLLEIALGRSGDPHLVVERARDDRPYFFRNQRFGLYYRGRFTDPRHQDALERAMARLRDKLDRLPADEVDAEALTTMAAWIRRQVRLPPRGPVQ